MNALHRNEDFKYQEEALERTHRWAKRSLEHHQKLESPQALFGIVQGGREESLRKLSAKVISEMRTERSRAKRDLMDLVLAAHSPRKI